MPNPLSNRISGVDIIDKSIQRRIEMTIPEDFDYGEQRADGQYENYPTIDEGDFVQQVRTTYVHEKCGTPTTMTGSLPESVARDPEAYSHTYCAGCQDHVPVEEVHWKEDGESWVVSGDA